jgi:hypothetical protein
MNIEAMIAEVNRRLDDPARPPMQLRTEPLTPAEVRHTVCVWQSLEHADRWLDVFERIADLPEPEQTRAIEALYIAVDVVQKFAA